MRLVIDRTARYAADLQCDNAREGQRLLNEKPVSVLYINHALNGRGTGMDVLRWAKQKDRLPLHVTITSTSHMHRQQLGYFLKANGFVGDGICFHRIAH